MSVMIWDSTSQAFKEAPTPMVYDSQNGAWRETTGLVWDNDAQAWTDKWGTPQVSAYVYGAVSETITIRKNGIFVATVQTDSSGKSTEQITLAKGTYTLTGSVSGHTEEQTVDRNTTKFRAMPEGLVLYWYGNTCNLEKLELILDRGNNYYTAFGGYITKKSIDLSVYKKYNSVLSNENSHMELDLNIFDDSLTKNIAGGSIYRHTFVKNSTDINITVSGRVSVAQTASSSGNLATVTESTNYADLLARSSSSVFITRIHAAWLS